MGAGGNHREGHEESRTPLAVEIPHEVFTKLRERLLAEGIRKHAAEEYLLNMNDVCLIPECRETLEWVNSKAAAKMMRITPQTLYAWTKRGYLKCFQEPSGRSGRMWFEIKELRRVTTEAGFGDFPLRLGDRWNH